MGEGDRGALISLVMFQFLNGERGSQEFILVFLCHTYTIYM